MDKLIHIDTFSGIGGFSLAADWVWPGQMEHIFCDNDPFCQQVLKKHWPTAEIYGDIRGLTTDAHRERLASIGAEGLQRPQSSDNALAPNTKPFLLTGGFPCQPFSQAGRRKGTEDDRYLWPEMLRVIREFRPRWVVGENVAGFVTWNDGMVLRQVLSDLEGEGYEVETFIIPAVAVNAPHRRDRVWIVASRSQGSYSNPFNERLQGRPGGEISSKNREAPIIFNPPGYESGRSEWSQNWLETATRLCGVDDGLPAELDGFKLSKSQHRVQRLKSLGNAIVPQVAEQIFKAIKEIDPQDPIDQE